MTKVETLFVLRTDEGPVRTLTLNRGERFNPLSFAVIAALKAELDAVGEDYGPYRPVCGARSGVGEECASAPLRVTPSNARHRTKVQRLSTNHCLPCAEEHRAAITNTADSGHTP
jgi:hypothetical protein